MGTKGPFQSNGSLIVDPKYIQEHQYYRSTMDRTLLPYVKSFVNSLQREAINVTYQSGDCLMSLYKHLLQKKGSQIDM